MINVTEKTRIMPDSNLIFINPTMLDCMENEENYIRNSGCTDEIKLIDDVIILTLNPRGCVPTDASKTFMFKEDSSSTKHREVNKTVVTNV